MLAFCGEVPVPFHATVIINQLVEELKKSYQELGATHRQHLSVRTLRICTSKMQRSQFHSYSRFNQFKLTRDARVTLNVLVLNNH